MTIKLPRAETEVFENSDLDSLLEKGISLTDRKKRKVLYDRVQTIVLEDLVILPLWHDKAVSIVKKGIKGYTLPDNGDFSTFPFVKK